MRSFNSSSLYSLNISVRIIAGADAVKVQLTLLADTAAIRASQRRLDAEYAASQQAGIAPKWKRHGHNLFLPLAKVG